MMLLVGFGSVAAGAVGEQPVTIGDSTASPVLADEDANETDVEDAGGGGRSVDTAALESGLSISASNVSFDGGKADITFMIDTSGSMSAEIAAVQSGLRNFTNTLQGENIDVRYSVVTFADQVPYNVRQTYSSNVTRTQQTLDAISTGGVTEQSFDTINDSIVNLNARPDADEFFILFTDEDADTESSTPNATALADRLDIEDISLFAVTLPEPQLSQADLSTGRVANLSVNGKFFNLAKGNFAAKFEQEIATEVTNVSTGLDVTVTQVRRPDFPEIEVFAEVRDGEGNPVTGLDASNFTITEDGTPQTIDSVETIGSSPGSDVSVALAIDRSGSMDDGSPTKLQRAEDAAIDFVQRLGADDEGLVISFSDDARIDRRWTRSKSDLVDAIEFDHDGYTELYGATIRGVEEAAPRAGRSAVIVLTDGISRRDSATLTEAVNTAQQHNVPVYTIGLGSNVDEQALKTLAADTGGDYYEAPSANDLSTIYQQISQQINDEYRITYTTSNTATDGTTRLVRTTAANATDQGSDTGQYVAPCAPLPTAAFSTSVSGQTVTLDASASSPNGGSIGAYRWDFTNDGQVDATGPTASHSYSSAGSFEVRLTVEKGCGVTDSTTRTVTIQPPSDDGNYTYRVPHTLNTQQLSSAWTSRVAIHARNESASVDIDTDGDGVAERSTAIAPGNATTLSTPPAGTVVRSSVPVTVEYRYGSVDFGVYEDGRYRYGVPEQAALGTEYYVPMAADRLDVAAVEATTVQVDADADGQFEVSRAIAANETIEVTNVSQGAHVLASEKIHVVVQRARWSNKDFTFASSLVPVSRADSAYDLPAQPSYTLQNPVVKSGVYVTATKDGTNVSVGSQIATLSAGETTFFGTTANVSLTADAPVVPLYALHIQSGDWWSSFRRENIGVATPVEELTIDAGSWNNQFFDGGLQVWSTYSGLNTSSQPAAPNFEVRNLTTLSTMVLGANVSVNAVVENTGGARGTQTVEFRLDGTTVQTDTVTLEAGEQTSVSFLLDTSGVSTGTHSLSVASDDDSESAQITVFSPGGKTVKVVPADPSLAVGGSQTFEVVLENATEGSQGYDLTVEVADSSVAEIVAAETVGDPAIQDIVNVSSDNSSVTITGGYLNPLNGSQSLTLATVTVDAVATGSTTLSVGSGAEIRNGTNRKYTLGSFESANVTVSKTVSMPGRQRPAQDVDGDGLLEDIDGDGQANVFDAIELANNVNAPVVQNNQQFFDFDADGKVDVFDAIELANEVRGLS